MIENMLDPEFVEPPGSDARRVETIDVDLTLRSTSEVEGGGVRNVYDFELFVWFNSTDAFRSLGIFEFLLAKDANGFWRVREQRERELLLRVEDDSWGSIKSIYR